MNIQEMHLDFKIKVNKIDSQQFAGLFVPQIDWLLNEAQEIFIKTRLGINNIYQKGLEASQKRIEDLRPLVVKNHTVTTSSLDSKTYEALLPSDYLYYLRSKANATKGNCTGELSIIIVQHDDLTNVLASQFYSPSFEWLETSAVFNNNSLYAYSDGSFSIDSVVLEYLRKPVRMAYPSGYENGSYELPDGTLVSTDQDSDFANNMFAAREIVDIAVTLATTSIADQRYELFQNKLKTNE